MRQFEQENFANEMSKKYGCQTDLLRSGRWVFKFPNQSRMWAFLDCMDGNQESKSFFAIDHAKNIVYFRWADGV